MVEKTKLQENLIDTTSGTQVKEGIDFTKTTPVVDTPPIITPPVETLKVEPTKIAANEEKVRTRLLENFGNIEESSREDRRQQFKNQFGTDLETPTPTPTVDKVPPVTTKPKFTPATPEDIGATPTADISAPTGKVETAQDIKAKELANKTTEDTQKIEADQKTTDQFNQAMETGDLSTALDLSIKNPSLKGKFNSIAKGFIQNKASNDFITKFSGMSNDQMLSEVNAGNLVPGSANYQLLPEEQKASFQEFKAREDALKNTEKSDFTDDNENIISLKGLVGQMKDLFSFDLRKKYNELLSSDEITETAKGLESLQNNINAEDDLLEKLEDEVREEFKGKGFVSESLIRSVVNDRAKGIIRNKNTLINQYNAKLGTYNSLKENAQVELDLLKFEDAQNKQVYNTALSLYETRRGEMRADEKANFLAENKKLASETQFSRQKELAQFKADLVKEKKTGGKYIDNGKGDLVYVVEGEEIKVLSGLGKAVGTSEDAEYTYLVKEQDDGSSNVYFLPKKKGLNPYVKSFGIDGTESTNWIKSTGQGNITSYGGEHDKFRGLDIDGNVGDPITVPLDGKIIEQQSHPQFGTTMVVKMSDGNKIRYSHLKESFGQIGDKVGKGAVVATMGNTGNVLKLDGKKPTKEELAQGFGSHLDIVTTGPDGKVRSAKNTETYLNNIGVKEDITGITGLEGFDSQDTPLYNSFLAGKLTSTQQKSIANFEEFKLKAQNYGTSLSEKGTPQIEKLLEIARDLKENRPARSWRIIAGTETAQFFDQELADYQANFDAFISNKAMDNLISLKSNGATFGALSEKELQIIKDGATSLRANLSDAKFNSELDRIIIQLEKGLSQETISRLKGGATSPSGMTIKYEDVIRQTKTNNSQHTGFFNTP